MISNLTSSSVEHPVKPSLSRVFDRDWLTLVATWPSSFSDFLTSTGLAGSSGRTSLVSCLRQADGTLAPSSGRWQNSGMGSATECSTLSTSEYPSDVVASSLSGILETGDVPQRYYLSARACEGILRRAAARKRTLPEQLRLALESVMMPTSSSV
jgi:hypothetical protein